MTHSLCYDYPLRPDFLAQVVIPHDLTALEARRLSAFLITLVSPTGQSQDNAAGQVK